MLLGAVRRSRGELDRFREKLDRELRSGLVGLSLLLAIAREGPQYGYALLRSIEGKSGGKLAFQEGTAYPVLANLEKQGLVAAFWSEGSGGPPRKYYQATELGKRALAAALEEWDDLTRGVDRLITAYGKEGKQR